MSPVNNIIVCDIFSSLFLQVSQCMDTCMEGTKLGLCTLRNIHFEVEERTHVSKK